VIIRSLGSVGTAAGMAFALGACASIIEGQTQRIAVNTNPPGAECGFYREQGIRLATIQSTPGDALIQKTKNDIWIVCVKPGYDQATYYNKSGVAGAAFANVIGGVFTLGIATVVGAAIDSSNGSDNMYASPVDMTMVANAGGTGQATLPPSYDVPKPIWKGQQPQAGVASSAGATTPEGAQATTAAPVTPAAATSGSSPAAATTEPAPAPIAPGSGLSRSRL
jgi:hypothetical protein